jgi:serine/threonine-protein kinase
MASVWCAHDRTLDRHVAVKLLAEPYAHDELAGRRFTREARAAARLSGHGNVVTIYDVGRALPSDELPLGRPFIVMEYLPGGTVADALRTGELDRTMIIKWLRQAASALDYAHRRGVIHRDVKLSNFLLDRERVLHVADFGIAQLGTEDTLSSSGHVLGTAAYLAPERALGLPATESSDRYGLAVAAFELLVGERPFIADNFAAQARQHLEEPPPRASHRNDALPSAVDAVLARGMAKHQDERFGTASELIDAIEQALSHSRATRPPVAQSLSPPAAVAVYGRRGRGRIAALAALAAVLIGVAIAAGVTFVPGASHRQSAVRLHALDAQHRARHQTLPHAARDQPRPRSAPITPAASPPSTTPTSPPSAATAPPAQPATTPTALEAQGHQLMVGGNYHGAIAVLRHAVAVAPHTSLTYAYALYDLGHSLRLAGDPRAAVPILWQRLQIPNQTNVVRAELTLALEALGQKASGGNGPLAARPGDHHRRQGD